MQFTHSNIAGYRWISNPNDQYIGKSLQAYGEWSYGEILLLARLLAPDANIIEVGGNIGAHTVPLAKRVPDGHVIAFEPQRLCFQMLCANVINNDCTNVTTYNMAVGDVAGSTVMADIDPDRAFNFGGIGVNQSTIAGPVSQHGRTPVVCLDDMIDAAFKVQLIKCDAEGMEVKVVKGAAQLIARDKPVLYLEDDRAALSQSLYETVRSFGYEVWWHAVPLYRPDNLAGNGKNIFENIYSFSLLCCHPSKPVDTSGLKKLESLDDHPILRNAKSPS
ncbi:MAG: FkbM family methyltransferase [Rhodospirillales bacterium]|nr:FkbM family methyltransferase [Rhodospirillales bacterium]